MTRMKVYGSMEFKTYNLHIQQDVELLFTNLQAKFFYTEKGAQQICICVLDNKLAEKFSK